MIFVVGAPRSGTTMTMSLLEACGARLGKVNSLNEISALRDGIIKPYLKAAGVDPLGQNPLMVPSQTVPNPQWRAKVTNAIGDATAAKILKGVHFWPLWVQHFPDAKYIYAYRHPEKVAQSCLRTKFMHAYSTLGEWREYAQAYHTRCRELSAEVDMRVLRTQDVVKGDLTALRIVVEWAGLEWNEHRVRAVIKPERWHG